MSSTIAFYLLRQSLFSLNLELTDWLLRMGSSGDLLVFLSLSLPPSPQVIDLHHEAQLLYGCWRSELRSLCLHNTMPSLQPCLTTFLGPKMEGKDVLVNHQDYEKGLWVKEKSKCEEQEMAVLEMTAKCWWEKAKLETAYGWWLLALTLLSSNAYENSYFRKEQKFLVIGFTSLFPITIPGQCSFKILLREISIFHRKLSCLFDK